MKKHSPGIHFVTITAMLVFTLCAGCSKQDPVPAVEEHASSEPESHVQHGTNGDVIITLDAATQKLMGLQTAPLAATELAPEVKGFGRVVDPAPLAELLIQFRKAQLVFDNSHQELERMKVLKQDNNTSERAFQTAEAAYLQNQADLGVIMFNLERMFGRKVAELFGPMVVPPGTERKPNPLLGEIAGARSVFLVRVDLPVSEALNVSPGGARIVGLSESARPVQAHYFGEVPAVDAQTQSRGYFFLVSTNQPKLTPGMAVTAFIQADEPAQSGVLVPRNAVVRFNGATWIYLQTGDETFQRIEVKLDRPLEAGWFVRDGLKAQDKVAIVGAQQLLSEELKGQGEE